jgi:hypothetical protein
MPEPRIVTLCAVNARSATTHTVTAAAEGIIMSPRQVRHSIATRHPAPRVLAAARELRAVKQSLQ